MVKLHIEPIDVHNQIWEPISLSPYGRCLNLTESERQKLTLQFLHTALEDIFLSIPLMQHTNFEDLLAPFVNQEQLNAYLMTYGVVGEPDIVTTKSTLTQESILGVTPTGQVEKQRHVLMSTECLVQLAFDDMFLAFRDGVEQLIRTACRRLELRFNPYSTVTLNPLISRNGRLLTLELILGEDIRHIYFRQTFPGGRYREGHQSEVRDLSGVRESAEDGHLDNGL